MSIENDPRPTWTDPAPTTQVPTTSAPATPVAPTTPATPATPAAAPSPVAPVVVTQPRKSGVWVNLLLGVAAIIAVGGVAFAIGRSTAPASAASIQTFPSGANGPVFNADGSFDPNGGPVTGNGRPGGLFGTGGPTIDGKVASISGDTMTITLPSGDTMTVKLDGDTTYHQSTDASAADVAVGDDVAVQVDGGRIQIGSGNANGNANGGDTPDLTASDVTVSR
jgi:hypothetical protein